MSFLLPADHVCRHLGVSKINWSDGRFPHFAPSFHIFLLLLVLAVEQHSCQVDKLPV